ncbi:hypothetical protein LKL35_36220 [Streptomyces sp. ET3-23]|uniref:hypothetical protein n=1 Tax=Streptomyces sp. ET3-23 TaxID=2885643 RepID=UPI001D118808|nr:hypothetical protein [Streptomyces sp. ET3-23]MCC2280781.1 hypothetical protein [Streptomyces sp. ET3-23]
MVTLGADAVVGEFDLGRVRGSLDIGSESGLGARFTTREPSTVLWRGMYVSGGLIGSARLKQRGEAEPEARWGLRPPHELDTSELYLTEPMDLSEIPTAPGEPTAD